jgi:hypothetical protein
MKKLVQRSWLIGLMSVTIIQATTSKQVSTAKPSQGSDTVRGMHLSALIDSDTFRRSDTAIVQLRLVNVSKSTIALYRHFGFGAAGFGFDIRDETGRSVEPKIIPDSFPQPPFSREDFALIKPNTSLNHTVKFALWEYDIKAAGKYQLWVVYNNPIPAKLVPKGLRAWTSEGRLDAKPVSFSVID